MGDAHIGLNGDETARSPQLAAHPIDQHLLQGTFHGSRHILTNLFHQHMLLTHRKWREQIATDYRQKNEF